MGQLIAFFVGSMKFSTVLLYGSTGETLTEKSGNLNLGIPGIMCFGALGGCVGVSMYADMAGGPAGMYGFCSVLFGIVFAFLFAGILGAVYSFFTTTLRCNQNVTGLTITTLGVGLTNCFITGVESSSFATASVHYATLFTFAEDLGWFGELLFSYGFLTYFAIAISLLTAFFLKKTKAGLYLRSVGESPATADAAGINVTAYKYIATIIGSGIAGLGGLYYVFNYLSGGWEYSIDGLGWMSIALVIFTLWKPDFGILGSIIFGLLYNCNSYMENLLPAQKELFNLAPYVVTIIVLIVTSIFDSKNAQPPQALGMNYFREER